MKKRVVITGGSGFIGSNFLRYMIGKYPDYEFVNVDKLTYSGNMENLKGLEGKYEFVNGDICDKRRMAEIIREGDIIVNFAAESHVDNSILDLKFS